MDCLSFPFSRVPGSSSLLTDYIEHYERVEHFYQGSPFHSETFNRLIQDLSDFNTDRKTLVEILLRQNKSFGAGDQTIENIQRLGDLETFAVVTGQQAGLFSGPAFTIYKALTAVRVSQWLTAQGIKTVPIFWLATEDHDLEEVSHVSVFDEEYKRINLCDTGDRPAPHSPVGRVKLTSAITEQLNLLESVLPANDDRGQLLEDLRSAYQPGATWSDAFARFLSRLFSRWGVILLDPLDESIHRLCVPTYQKALHNANELRTKLAERSTELIRSGYHAQVHIGEESTLLFAQREGDRLAVHRRSSDGEQFSIGDNTAPLEELESEIKERPVNFSANVLLRPIVQDALLPTIAYVAGPSELAYLAQSEVLYSSFGRPMPAIFPRSGFTLVDRRVERWMEKYRVGVEDIWQGKEYLSQRIASTSFAEGWDDRFDQTERDLADLMRRLRKDLEVLDPTLVDALNHAEEKIQYQVERLKGKMTRAALSRSEVLARHEQALLHAVMPEKELQERMVSGVYFLGRAGYSLLDRLLEQIPTGSSCHCIMNF